MRQNQKNRFGGRYNNSRTTRTQTIMRNTALESSGPCGKLHGTALQLFEKYQAAAKDALLQNDLILSESCLQYADHYMRLQNIAIANEQAFRANNTAYYTRSYEGRDSVSEKGGDNNQAALSEESPSAAEEGTSPEEPVLSIAPVRNSGFKSRRRMIPRTVDSRRTEPVNESVCVSEKDDTVAD